MKRVTYLESHYVSREDLNETLTLLRTDRRQMHEENRGHLDSIERKIEQGNKEQRDARFELVDRVQKVDMKIAAITGESTGPYRK